MASFSPSFFFYSALVVALGAYLGLGSAFLSWFSTPLHGPWVFKDYPLLMAMGGLGLYIAPPVAVMLSLLAVSID